MELALGQTPLVLDFKQHVLNMYWSPEMAAVKKDFKQVVTGNRVAPLVEKYEHVVQLGMTMATINEEDRDAFMQSTAVVEGLKAQDVLMHFLKTGSMDKMVNFMLNHSTSADLSTKVPGATVYALNAKTVFMAASTAALAVAATVF